MKVIDLLNKIANGEEVPKKIKIKDEIWTYDDDIDYKASDDRGYLLEVHTRLNKDDLNEELEVIEEDKKIDKIEIYYNNRLYNQETKHFNQLTGWGCVVVNKINEIIDKLNKEKE